ncbi:MAG: hypothetical protein WC827_03795 [Candidatus Paceibacterota bacterium]|jgi:hypothetical protein
MIAIFTYNENTLHEFSVYPKIMFKRITRVEDILGYKFTAIIAFYDWFKAGKDICDAYTALKQRQPELFNK